MLLHLNPFVINLRYGHSPYLFIEVNVITLTKLTKLFLPDFVKHGDGRILNV